MKKTILIFLLICGFAFITRAAYIATMDNSKLALYEDDWTYHTIAKNVIDGKGYHTFNTHLNGPQPWYSFRPPLFVMFLIVVYTLFGWGNFLAAKLTLSLVGVLLSVSSYFLGKKMFDRNTGIIAAAVTAIFPSFVFYSTHIQGEIIYVFLLSMTVLCLYLDFEKESKISIFVSGIFLALCSLTRSMIAPFMLVIIFWLLVTKKLKKGSLAAIIFLAGFILCVSPWWYRNYNVYHRFVPFTTEGGFTLWVGNNPLASGGGECVIPSLSEEERKLADYQLDKVFYQKSVDYIRENPGRFIKLGVSKFVRFWRPFPLVGGKIIQLINIITYVPLYILAGIGIYFSFKQWRKFLLLYLLFLYYTTVHSVFPSMTRYRLPLEPYLIIFAVVAVTEIWKKKLISST